MRIVSAWTCKRRKVDCVVFVRWAHHVLCYYNVVLLHEKTHNWNIKCWIYFILSFPKYKPVNNCYNYDETFPPKIYSLNTTKKSQFHINPLLEVVLKSLILHVCSGCSHTFLCKDLKIFGWIWTPNGLVYLTTVDSYSWECPVAPSTLVLS